MSTLDRRECPGLLAIFTPSKRIFYLNPNLDVEPISHMSLVPRQGPVLLQGPDGPLHDWQDDPEMAVRS